MPFSFKEWYELNGKKLNAQRKERYKSDPEYREKVLKSNQDSRRAKKRTAKPRKRQDRKWKTVEISGVSEELFSIGAVAEKLDCSIQAIRLWEKKGIIPPPPHRGGLSQTGDRLYTKAHIEKIKKILKAQGRIGGPKRTESSSARPLKRYIRFADGSVQAVPLFLIGALAEALERRVNSVEQLEARGVIPPTPFRATSVGRRLYTAEMISAVKDVVESLTSEPGFEPDWSQAREAILDRWTAQNIMGAVLVETVPPEEDTANAEEART